jgi:hypothetical protein
MMNYHLIQLRTIYDVEIWCSEPAKILCCVTCDAKANLIDDTITKM